MAAARLEQNVSVLAALERDARRLAAELREARLLLQERASRRLAVRAAVGSLATIEPFAPVSPRHDRASEAEAEELRLAMAFPVPGAVAFDARSGKSARRGPGVAILSSELRPILAPSGGRVVFAGPFRRLGLLLIIEHAHAYHSLVLGASRLEVQVGATVAAGDIVGWLEPRPAERAELYFEVRRAGEPIAPESVLAARKGGMRG
ncbi:MAG: peptidoglycan DD-metalloendopeptidase family protein [Geminicoccaceae bacterium]|nr:peptidoglycan DD-metalloendopeptidase family protein [Geminicoccaceae bacterium]